MDNMPNDRPLDRQMRPVEPVQVDNIWATPSTLHMRVTVWGPDFAWRRKYDVHVPLDAIPREAVEGMMTYYEVDATLVDEGQESLF